MKPQDRWVGLLPLLFFLLRFFDVLEEGQPGNILWACHLSNLTLALGILLNQPWLVRLSLPWLIMGVPLWIWNVAVFGLSGMSSVLTHIGGAIVAAWVLPRVGLTRYSWLYAGLWYLFLQGLSRILTDPELNINIAFRPYFGWETMFGSFSTYWLALTLMLFVCLWLFNWILRHRWPADT